MNKIIIEDAIKSREKWIQDIKNLSENFGSSSNWIEKELNG